MDRLGYSAAAGMRAAMARQTEVANNLANSNTTGFRADMSAATAIWLQGGGTNDTTARAMPSEAVVAADMTAGTIVQTGHPLDVAMEGDAMLTVQAADGEEAYTRRGDLMMSASGLLTTGEGTPVLGEGGPISLPPYSDVKIGADGTVSIVPIGGDRKDLQVVDRLKLVSPKGSKIAKGLDGLFRVQGGGALPSDPEAKVRSESLEGSNVNASQAIIEMIEAGRSWDTQVKMLATSKEIDTDASKLMSIE